MMGFQHLRFRLGRFGRLVRRRGAAERAPTLAWLRAHLDREWRDGAGRPVRLEPRSRQVLRALIDANGAIVTKADLLDRFWAGVGADEAVIASVARLRRALRQIGAEPDLVQTAHGVGYRLNLRAAARESGPKAKTPALWRRARLAAAAAALTAVLAAVLASAAMQTGPRPAPPDPILARAEALLARESTEDAREAVVLLQSLATAGDDAQAWLSLADLYTGKAARLEPDADALHRQAVAGALAAGAPQGAINVRAAQHAFLRRFDVAAARALLDQAEAQDSEPASYIRALVLIHDGRHDAAARIIDAALAAHPGADRLVMARRLNEYVAGRSFPSPDEAASFGSCRWIDALSAMREGRHLEARETWLSLFDGVGVEARAYDEASPEGFARFVDALDEAGAASCIERAFAAAATGETGRMARELDRCEQERHPLAVWRDRLPIFAEAALPL
ncbi:MAG: winged helix-turn-helix domain-containing protein [Oceanicaulis sp.]